MKIKDYKCKCGRSDFFFSDLGNQKGIYCSYCGKWLKWADKDERNLRMKQEPAERIGEWVGVEFDSYADGCPVYDVFECSVCKDEHYGEADTLTPYCPNCGARMEGGNEEE